jgi:hypothetical protein
MDKTYIKATIESLTLLILKYPIDTEVDLRLFYEGWSPIGIPSVFGVVFVSPCGEMVLRLGHDCDDLLVDNYPFHIENCLNYPENPYFQKVYWQAIHPNHEKGHPHKSLNITLMEKLEFIETKTRSAHEQDFIKRALDNDYDHYEDGFTSCKNVFVPNESLTEALMVTRQTKDRHNLLFDMSYENLMMRRDEQLVLLDPLQ